MKTWKPGCIIVSIKADGFELFRTNDLDAAIEYAGSVMMYKDEISVKCNGIESVLWETCEWGINRPEQDSMFKLLQAVIESEGTYYTVDDDKKGFTYKFSAETGNWRTVGRGREVEWQERHFTLEEAMKCGFKAIKGGILEPIPEVVHGVVYFKSK